MNILIIEDEPRTAKSLEKIITEVRTDAAITGLYQSVESSVKALAQNPPVDLIFMDIQLADGLSFEIFKQVTVSCPVIFCTAFDEYAIEAFRQNGIDYILKPFSQQDIAEAFRKADALKSFYQQKAAPAPDFSELISRLGGPAGKTSFLVFHDQKYMTVATEEIAFFYVSYNATCIKCFDKKEYVISQSLDQIAAQVSAKQFFRVNRQYLVNFKAIKEIEHYFMRKLYIKLVIDTKEKLLVNKEKAPRFFAWMEDR
ncbi:LytR/AlgR family response regulator transcription factor [Taibaiella chishuiensis]|uniref:LytTR family two component transcriptional regulator n=1 Tax=Taibaiella chishuiensis TaxID=1434707 RepID=A0A2P8D356_9BACT|nr:LytTR family DNA-binding domain-containing protein [Taibaiella chishuiensis]PSK91654.1 LytTR family two component transcriptional regulator [Taibaiella chishuiensis]